MEKEVEDNALNIADLLTDASMRVIPITESTELDLRLDLPETLKSRTLNPGQTFRPIDLIVHEITLGAARGQAKSIQEFLDRVVGKPSQSINVAKTVSYVDYLKEVLASEDETPHPTPTPTSLGSDRLPPELPVNIDAIEDEETLLDEMGGL